MIRNLNIGTRIALGYLLILLIFLIVSFYSVIKLTYSDNQLKTLYERPLTVKGKLLSLNANIDSVRRLLRRAYFLKSNDAIVETKNQVASIELEIFNDLTVSEGMFPDYKNLTSQIRSHYDQFIALHDYYYKLLLQGKKAEALNLLDIKIYSNVEEIEKLLKEAIDLTSIQAVSLLENAHKSNEKYKHNLYYFICVAILLISVLSFVFTRMITVPISRLLKSAKEIGSGIFNVTIDVSSKDEIGQLSQAFQEMTDNLRHNISGSEQLMDALRQELALQSSIAKVTEALFDLKYDKYDISKIVHDEALILTGSEHGYASLLDENGDNVAINLTDMIDKECKVAKEQQITKFPDGYNAMWGYSLNTGEDFFTNSPKEHNSYMGCAPPGHVEIRNFLSVPVKSGGRIIGQIALANPTRDYTERDLSIIRQLASIYAVALERKDLEERLKESEQRFRIIFEKAPIGVAITEAATGNLVQLNQKCCNITGYSSDEIMSLRFQDITHPDDIQRQIDGLKRLHRGDIPVFSMEKRYIHKNSKIVWVTITTIPLYVGSNQPKLNLTIVDDITDKKQMEEALKESELDVKEAQSKAHFGTWIDDPVTQQPKWSLEMYNIWGVDPKLGPLSYSDLSNYIHPDEWHLFDDTVRESIELHKPYELEIRLCMSDKTEKIIRVIGEPILDAAGKVVKLRGSNQDITRRKSLEAKLEEVRTQLQSILDSSPTVVFLKDLQGRYILINSRYEMLFHVTKKDVAGKTDYDIFPKELADYLRANDSEVERRNEPVTFEEIVPQYDGLHTYISVKFPMVDRKGQVYGICGIATDITERKRMEEDLERLNGHLMELVAEETQKRQRDQQLLIQQSKMAAMGEMIGLIAHQWRQPLNAIGMTVQDVKQAYLYGEVDEEYIKNTVATTMKHVFFMSKTIDDFKNFFKPSKEKVLFNVAVAIEELFTMFSYIFKKSDIDILLDIGNDMILFTDGYPNEFKQVVLNIMNNAKDAIISKREAGEKPSQGRIEIDIRNNEQKDKIILSMRDNGGGIPEDVAGKIFEPYYTTKGEQGTGIGLYMSKTIIETNMGGTLTVRNVDEGAEFMITLGISKSEAV